MTCSECDNVQKSFEYVSFIRVDKSNVMLVGCREHLKKLMDAYNLGTMTKDVVNNKDGGLLD